MSSTFINGYVKDVPLKNNTFDETMGYIQMINKQFGRKSLIHN